MQDPKISFGITQFGSLFGKCWELDNVIHWSLPKPISGFSGEGEQDLSSIFPCVVRLFFNKDLSLHFSHMTCLMLTFHFLPVNRVKACLHLKANDIKVGYMFKE